MKLRLEGVVVEHRAIGASHLVRVGIKMKGTNENLTIGPTLPEVMVWLTCTAAQAKLLPVDTELKPDSVIEV